jgi:hypothetical protein
MLLKNLFEATQGKTAVLGWGRGMGHKGHMLLAKAVLHHAQENNAKAYFVVSRTSLVDPATGQPWTDRPTFTKTKDDPLTPEEKLATYRKVFPQNAEVFSVASADATKLEQVLAKIAKDGYRNVTLVVGEDQKNSMGYLTNPDKSGVPPFKQAGLDNLTIISRQDTTEPSSAKGSPDYQEGPRATPMRAVLTDPTKSEEEQFAVWRDAMPDNLSDDEVLDLMNKAKQRMAAVPAAKGRKAVAELSNELLGRYKKAAGADAKKADAEGDYARGNKRFSGIVKATKKQFANDEKGVAEAGSNAMTDTAKRLADKDDGKVAKLRAAGDKRREEELKGRNIAKRNDEDFEIVENDKPNDPIVRQIQQMLNDKFGANLDIDGYLGPLTKKSIKKFLPAAKTGSAPKPGLPTAVQPISESVDPKVSIVFDKYNPPDKDSIDGWKVAAKTKYWMVGTNKVKKDPKNPLPHEVKLVCLETAMPRINEHLEIVDDWLALAVKAYKKYGDIELVVCTRHDSIFKEILKANDHKGKHGYFKFDKITKVATPYYRHDKELKQALINKDKTAFKRSSGVSPDKRIVAEHKRYEYFDLLEKFMIKRIPIVSLNESKFLPLNESIESQMENLIKRLENK